MAASITGLPFATAARGDNLAPADPDLGDKLEAAFFIRANNAADLARIEAFDQGQASGKVALVYNSLTLPPAPPESAPTDEPTPPGAVRPMPRPVRLLALGRFDVTKGFDVLLRACALLRDRGLDFTLTLAGGGGAVMGLGRMSAQIVQLRKELALESRVNLPGLISHNDLPHILESHDIFAAPCIVHKSAGGTASPTRLSRPWPTACPW